MLNANLPFYEVIGEAIRAGGLSLNEISAALHQRGFSIDKATLSRWTTGTQPTLKQLGALRCLPEVLGLSLAQQTAFQRALNRWLRDTAGLSGAAPLAYRRHTLGSAPSFVGRAAELQHVQSFVDRHRSVAITGLGGVGKTTLALQVLHLCADHFVSGCEALVVHANQSTASIVVHVARRLGIHLPQDTPLDDSGALLDWLSTYTAEIDLLFLLDNVSAEAQVSALIQQLHRITWVLTSRRPLALSHVAVLALEAPDDEEAASLLLNQAGLPGDPTTRPLAQQIAGRLGNLPLAISCAAGLTTLLDSDLKAVWQRLDSGGLNVLRLDYADLPRFFGLMLDHQLPSTQRVFELCGAFGLPQISSAIFQLMADRLHLHLAGLLSLGDLSLVKWPEGNEFFVLHPLIHEYAAQRLQHALDETEVRRVFSAVYAELAQTWRQSRDYETMQGELENVLAAANYAYDARDWEIFWLFWSPVTHYLWVNGDQERYAAFDARFLEAARARGDRLSEAEILLELAWTRVERREWSVADRFLREALAVCKSLPDGALLYARALRYQAKISDRLQQPERARSLLQTAEEIVRGQGPVQGRIALSLALIYLHLAQLAYRTQRGEQAISVGRAALQFCDLAGPDGYGYWPGIAVDVGDMFYTAGDQEQAEQHWLAATDSKWQPVEDESPATAAARLAYLAALRGNKEEALRLARTAHQIYLQRGLVRYSLRVGEWLRNYEDNDAIGPLLDLAQFENEGYPPG
jgi:hypothetical protein